MLCAFALPRATVVLRTVCKFPAPAQVKRQAKTQANRFMSLSNAAAKLADDTLGKREVAQQSTQPDVSGSRTMKAIVWKNAKQVACEDKPLPRVTHPKDVVVKVTQCSICSGSDSHIYSGEVVTMDEGLILGHEACGIVDQVGSEVTKFLRGDRVVIAFDIACGECVPCQKHEYTGCDRTNDSQLFEEMYGGPPGAAIYGYSRLLGNVPGSQAEYVRVPFADVNCYKIPDDVPDEKALFVSDVLPTALHAVEMGCVRQGDTVAIWGLGPIGLYAAKWSQLKGASRVIGIDLVPERLHLARAKFGMEVLDRSDLTSAQVVSKLRGLLPQGGVDVAIDATGFRFAQSWTHTIERVLGMETDASDILVECMSLVRKFGHVSIIADYIGYANHFPVGHIMMKHLTVRSGQCPVQKYFKYVMDAIQQGTIDPSWMVTHRLPLEDVPHAYEQLFYKKEGYIKVVVDVADRQQQPQAQEQEQGVMSAVGETMRGVGEKTQPPGQEMQGHEQEQTTAMAQQESPQIHQHPEHLQQQQGQQGQQEQQEPHEETEKKEPSLLTKAMQAMKMTSSSSDSPQQQKEEAARQQQQHEGEGEPSYEQQQPRSAAHAP